MTQKARQLAEELRHGNQAAPAPSNKSQQQATYPQDAQNYPAFNARYKLISPKGDGAFSVVYKALDIKTGNYVAVKLISKTSLNVHQVFIVIFIVISLINVVIMNLTIL